MILLLQLVRYLQTYLSQLNDLPNCSVINALEAASISWEIPEERKRNLTDTKLYALGLTTVTHISQYTCTAFLLIVMYGTDVITKYYSEGMCKRFRREKWD